MRSLDFLLKRRSVKAEDLAEPAPSAEQLQNILTAAARVPDHGKTVPFYFLVFQGRTRDLVGAEIARLYAQDNPMASEMKVAYEAERFSRAPLVVAVIYRKRHAKHPLWEQMLTTGAVCQNLLLAAHASGFAGQWLSEWYSYNEEFRSFLGLDERDIISGFIHIGTPPDEKPEDRPRPDLSAIVTHWHPSEGAVNKGDSLYDLDKFDIPQWGFKLK